ncbi:Hypothetical protein LOCK900_2361 [Lacticaseibacillus rhamnosus LOCK900]|nr:Hypothetical protein LOCK900_2361 [Lacticaseibacillus rhamnosus LOCK900]
MKQKYKSGDLAREYGRTDAKQDELSKPTIVFSLTAKGL